MPDWSLNEARTLREKLRPGRRVCSTVKELKTINALLVFLYHGNTTTEGRGSIPLLGLPVRAVLSLEISRVLVLMNRPV